MYSVPDKPTDNSMYIVHHDGSYSTSHRLHLRPNPHAQALPCARSKVLPLANHGQQFLCSRGSLDASHSNANPSMHTCCLQPTKSDDFISFSCPSLTHHDLKLSLMLWLLALIGGAFDDGKIPILGLELCLTLETAYTMPLTNPTKMADTLGMVTGASKKMRPDTAIGSLLRAPTME